MEIAETEARRYIVLKTCRRSMSHAEEDYSKKKIQYKNWLSNI